VVDPDPLTPHHLPLDLNTLKDKKLREREAWGLATERKCKITADKDLPVLWVDMSKCNCQMISGENHRRK
jgi:hypothetical protein